MMPLRLTRNEEAGASRNRRASSSFSEAIDRRGGATTSAAFSAAPMMMMNEFPFSSQAANKKLCVLPVSSSLLAEPRQQSLGVADLFRRGDMMTRRDGYAKSSSLPSDYCPRHNKMITTNSGTVSKVEIDESSLITKAPRRFDKNKDAETKIGMDCSDLSSYIASLRKDILRDAKKERLERALMMENEAEEEEEECATTSADGGGEDVRQQRPGEASSADHDDDASSSSSPSSSSQDNKAAAIRAMRLELAGISAGNALRESSVADLRARRHRLRSALDDLKDEECRHAIAAHRTEALWSQIRYVIDVRADEVSAVKKIVIRRCCKLMKLERRWKSEVLMWNVWRECRSSSLPSLPPAPAGSGGVSGVHRELVAKQEESAAYHHFFPPQLQQEESSRSLATMPPPSRRALPIGDESSRSVLSAPVVSSSHLHQGTKQRPPRRYQPVKLNQEEEQEENIHHLAQHAHHHGVAQRRGGYSSGNPLQKQRSTGFLEQAFGLGFIRKDGGDDDNACEVDVRGWDDGNKRNNCAARGRHSSQGRSSLFGGIFAPRREGDQEESRRASTTEARRASTTTNRGKHKRRSVHTTGSVETDILAKQQSSGRGSLPIANTLRDILFLQERQQCESHRTASIPTVASTEASLGALSADTDTLDVGILEML